LKKEQAEEVKKLKDKYSKQSQLLDTEQLECKKLEEENEKLKAEINQLKGGSH
jgi:cell division protein FtsB